MAAEFRLTLRTLRTLANQYGINLFTGLTPDLLASPDTFRKIILASVSGDEAAADAIESATSVAELMSLIKRDLTGNPNA